MEYLSVGIELAGHRKGTNHTDYHLTSLSAKKKGYNLVYCQKKEKSILPPVDDPFRNSIPLANVHINSC